MAVSLAKRRNTAMNADKLTQKGISMWLPSGVAVLAKETHLACALRLAGKTTWGC